MLGEESQFSLAVAASEQSAIEQIENGELHLVLLDVTQMDELALPELIDRIRRLNPGVPVIVFAVYAPRKRALGLLEAGAAGCLIGDFGREELTAAIDSVAAGRRYLSPDIRERLLDRALRTPATPHWRLSLRERQVLRGISAGKSLTRIGQELKVSVKTVSTYRVRLLDKMGMASNAELIRYAIEHGLDDAETPGGGRCPPAR